MKGWDTCDRCETERPLDALEAVPIGDRANRQRTAHRCRDTAWCDQALAERLEKKARLKRAIQEEP